MNSIKLSNRVDTIFINSENSKVFDLHILLFKLSGKIKLKRSDKYVAVSDLTILLCTILGKTIKKSYKNNTFKISSNVE